LEDYEEVGNEMVETRKRIDIDAPPSVAFKALTDERELVRWMPKEAKMHASVGGDHEFKYYWAEREPRHVAPRWASIIVPVKEIRIGLLNRILRECNIPRDDFLASL
jgi:uncharacterized protein YndB with AHSA1/START domain